MKKIVLAVLLAVACWLPGTAVQAITISVNQFVEHPALDAVLKGFQDSMKKQGVEAEYKVYIAQANMGTATQIGQQMIGDKSDLLLAIATPSAQAVAQALKKAPADMKRPFLFTAVTDPVAAGLVDNLDAPGGLITGVSDKLPLEEHINMILTFMPDLKKLGFLYNAGEANSKVLVPWLQKIAAEKGFEVVEATAAKTADVFQAAKSLVGRVDAIFIPTDNTIIETLESVIKVGVDNKLPVFAADTDSVARGAVAAMGFDYYLHGVQTGLMAKKILDGADPATTPVEFQEELQLYINTTYAGKMGITPPPVLLEKATKVIE